MAAALGARRAYERMLADRHWLYRPWLAVIKTAEAAAFGGLELARPVLDLGCGDGVFTAACFGRLEAGPDLAVGDLERAAGLGTHGLLVAGRSETLPFASGSFASVVSVCALEHMSRLDDVLAEVSRVLKPGGRLAFSVPSTHFAGLLFGPTLLRLAGLSGAARRYGEAKNRRSTHLHVLTPAQWAERLARHGLVARRHAYLAPPALVLAWSFMCSTPFKLMFAPFRLARSRPPGVADRLLRRLLLPLGGWIERQCRPAARGGYLLVVAEKCAC